MREVTHQATGFAIDVPLPKVLDTVMWRWSKETPGATWDQSGGHLTIARMNGRLSEAAVTKTFKAACRAFPEFPVRLSRAVRSAYWEKPGLEIVMLVGGEPGDTLGMTLLRERLLQAFLELGLELREAGEYIPHVTLTTGLAPEDAQRLVNAASEIVLEFTASEVDLWTGPESDGSTSASSPWHSIARANLGPSSTSPFLVRSG